MNSHDFYMTLGAKSGLLLDSEQGILIGKSNGFKVNALRSGGKFILSFVPVKDGVYPSGEDVKSILANCDITSITTNGKAVLVTTGNISSNLKGCDKATNVFSSITQSFKELGYEDDSINHESDMELKGKDVSVTIGGGLINGYVGGFLGACVAIAISGGLIVWLHSIHAIFAMFAEVSLLLLLVIGLYEIFGGPRTYPGMALLFVMLIIGTEILVRLKTASYAVFNVDTVADTFDLLNQMVPEAHLDEILQIKRMTLGEMFWQLPSIFKASGDFLRDLVIGYCESALIVILAITSYRKGNKSLFSYLSWIWNAIFH